jgi:hypothetical protein
VPFVSLLSSVAHFVGHELELLLLSFLCKSSPMFPDVNQPSYCLLGGPFDPSMDMVRISLLSVHLENWRRSDLDPRCHAAHLFSYGLHFDGTTTIDARSFLLPLHTR